MRVGGQELDGPGVSDSARTHEQAACPQRNDASVAIDDLHEVISQLPVGITVQDLDGEVYRRMVRRFVPALSKHPPLVYAAGHDHGLQVIEGRNTAGTLVVSGAGSAKNVTTVTAIAGTLFAGVFCLVAARHVEKDMAAREKRRARPDDTSAVAA